MPVSPDIPQVFLDAGGYVGGVILLLILVAALAGAYTLARRAVRHGLISQRREGWGGPDHPNQEIPSDSHTPSALETIKRLFLSTRREPPQLPDRSRKGSDPAPAHDSTEGADS